MSKPDFPPDVVEFFRRVGRKGGKTTASRQTPEQRSERCRQAALARYAKQRDRDRMKGAAA